MTSIRDLAEAARMMPWDKSKADVPFETRKAFADAMTPELFLEMLDALRRAALALAFAAESSAAMRDDYEVVSAAIEKVTQP